MYLEKIASDKRNLANVQPSAVISVIVKFANKIDYKMKFLLGGHDALTEVKNDLVRQHIELHSP
jgi:hypothetical protein